MLLEACGKFVYPHTQHPVFSLADGKDKVPLNEQAQILFCRAAQSPSGQTGLLTGKKRQLVENLTRRWQNTVRKAVLKKQSKMRFGDQTKWTECEVDEVTCRGEKSQNGKRVTWFQYCGMLTRGDRRSLVLEKMRVKSTWVKRRGKGKGSMVSPGPITKREWLPLAKRWFRMRKIILHCDGARSYKFTKLPGMKTDHARHKRPKPIYAARKLHCLPRDYSKTHLPAERRGPTDKLWVMTGTQLIDNFWQQLKNKGMPKTTIAEGDVKARLHIGFNAVVMQIHMQSSMSACVGECSGKARPPS